MLSQKDFPRLRDADDQVTRICVATSDRTRSHYPEFALGWGYRHLGIFDGPCDSRQRASVATISVLHFNRIHPVDDDAPEQPSSVNPARRIGIPVSVESEKQLIRQNLAR